MGSEADFAALLAQLQRGPVEWVRVVQVRGSAPREVGAWLALGPDGLIGTVGGGHLEWQALQRAQQRLAADPAPEPETVRYPLGPALGQCCGGVVWLRYERLADPKAAQVRRAELVAPAVPLALLGGGHVARALVAALAPLPFALTWLDERSPQALALLPATAEGRQPEQADPLPEAVADLAAGSAVLIMTHRHDLDLAIVQACLRRRRVRADLPFIGLIGSHSKWNSFQRRLRAHGWHDEELQAVTCPLGVPGIRGKQPAVIAASIAAQLLQTVYTWP